MGKIKNMIQWGGAALVLAAGVFGSYKLIDNEIDKINKTEENIVLYNTKIALNENFDKERTAYTIADFYLYNKKNIKINTLNDGSDFEMAGGISRTTESRYNSLVKEIAVYQDNAFVPIQPTSQEYANILNERNKLASSLLNSTVFVENASEDMVDFGNFITDNLNNDELKWNKLNTASMIASSLFCVLLSLGYAALVEKIDEDLYY